MPTFLRPSLEKFTTSVFFNVRHVDLTSERPTNEQAKSKVWAIYQPIEKVKHFLIPIKIIIRTQSFILLHKKHKKTDRLRVFTIQSLSTKFSMSWVSPPCVFDIRRRGISPGEHVDKNNLTFVHQHSAT